MLNVFNSQIYEGGALNPAYPVFTGFGYDPHSYIRTAGLAPSPYTAEQLIVAKLGGLNRLIEACDDSQPPLRSFTNPPAAQNAAWLTYQAVLQAVTTEINGYLSSIYPIPLAQTGTVCVLQVTAVSTDGLNSITSLDVVEPGNYLVAPAVDQYPVYLKYTDPLSERELWQNINVAEGQTPYLPRSGTGAHVTAAYTAVPFSDESGEVINVSQVAIAPTIVSGGQNYCLNDLLVLVGGSSIVPAQIRQAMLDLVCHTLYKRKLTPDEINPFRALAKQWRDLLADIREGNAQLDGTFKRSFSAVTSWGRESVLNGANSL